MRRTPKRIHLKRVIRKVPNYVSLLLDLGGIPKLETQEAIELWTKYMKVGVQFIESEPERPYMGIGIKAYLDQNPPEPYGGLTIAKMAKHLNDAHDRAFMEHVAIGKPINGIEPNWASIDEEPKYDGYDVHRLEYAGVQIIEQP